MSLSIKYIPVYTQDIDSEVEFFIKYFNLIYSGKIHVSEDVEGVLLKLDTSIELYLLFIPTGAEGKNAAPDYKIIMNTNNCIKEYLTMKNSGVEFDARPQHLPVGLAANFKVADGNHYLLLEERDYNDNEE